MTMRSEKFSLDFVMGGAAAVISKSAAAPLERVKLLLQNQGEMIKRGQLKRPYTGVGECSRRIFREEGLLSFWRGNQANIIRYFPTQVFSFSCNTLFALKDFELDIVIYEQLGFCVCNLRCIVAP